MGSSSSPSFVRALAPLLALALALSACTGSEDPAEDATEAEQAQDGDEGEGEGAAPGGGGEVADVARAWLADTYGLSGEVLDALEVAEVTTSPGVEHVRFVQTADGIEILDAEITVHVLESGEVQSATDDLVTAEPSGGEVAVDEAQALDVASKAVTGELTGEPAAAEVWVRNGEALQRAWRVELATDSPMASWIVLVDAASAQVISAEQATFGRHGAAAHQPPGAAVVAGTVGAADKPGVSGVEVAQAGGDACVVEAPGACVFLPDPIYAAGGELGSPSQANDHLAPVELLGLDDPTALVGEFVNTEPAGLPIEPTREEDGTWAGGRAAPGFEAAMVYYWIDRVQRHIQDLGFSGVLDDPFEVIPIDPDVVDNAFYSPAERRIHMGVGSDGIHEGEDANGIVHEYGHAVLDAQAPGILGSPEGGAYHESFGDLLALLTTLEHRDGDIGCLFAWAEAGECLRRLDSDKVYPDDLQNQVHADGEIYNGAIYDVLEALLAEEGLAIEDCPGTTDCTPTADRVLQTLLASHSYLPNDPTLPDVAQAFLLADAAVSGGADVALLEAAFAAHGLVGGGQSMVDGGGEAMAATDGVALQVEIVHSYRGDLEVIAGVLGPDGADLCEPIQLVAPDETDDADDLIGEVDVTDTACAGLVPPAPDQAWYLQVIDTLAEDEGQINQFAVVVDGVPYLAGGLPSLIPDADPQGAFAVVAGTGETVEPESMTGMSDGSAGGGPVLSVDISHTYVGDLRITAGVVDADSTIICSVTALEADPSNPGDGGIGGDIDLSSCAEHYPPGPDRRWYLLVVDTAAVDEGTVDQLVLTGPDGQTFAFDAVPVAIPDADVDGVALLLDGAGGSSGQAGGGGTSADLTASLQVTHPYQGDLAVTAGAVSAEGDVLCEVVLASPDQANAVADLAVDASMADCARHYPPTAAQPWFVFAADTLAADTGTLDAFTVTGPDGATYGAAGLPLALPDADPDGVFVLLEPLGGGSTGGSTGATGGGTAGGEVTADVAISHSYVGDLEINVGVTDADGQVLCEEAIRTPDAQDASADLAGPVSFGACSELYPPSAGAVFYLEVIDTAAADTGQVDAFTLVGPDGQRRDAGGLPAPIPDDDPSGVVIPIFG
jgi:subtilisin-like proprotein convertase family protein